MSAVSYSAFNRLNQCLEYKFKGRLTKPKSSSMIEENVDGEGVMLLNVLSNSTTCIELLIRRLQENADKNYICRPTVLIKIM